MDGRADMETTCDCRPPGTERPGGYNRDQNGNVVLYWMSGQSDVSYGWDSRDMLVNYNDAAYYRYRCLCQVDLGARGDFVLSSISLS